MTASEKIIGGIREEAEKAANAVKEKAEKEAAAFIAAEAEKSEKKADNIIKEAEKKAALTEKSGKSAAALSVRDKALKHRRMLIEKLIDETVDAVNALSDGEYFSHLYKLAEKNALSSKGELMLSAKDLARDNAGFKNAVADLGLTVSEKAADINGGFLLKYGDIYINCAVSALKAEKYAALVDCVNTELFGQG